MAASRAIVADCEPPTIPIVFTTAADPVQLGLVASLNRPEGNVTGATQLTVEVAPKLECALDGGQFQAAVLTGCWTCRSSYCAGLR